jgi:hypothetical protein
MDFDEIIKRFAALPPSGDYRDLTDDQKQAIHDFARCLKPAKIKWRDLDTGRYCKAPYRSSARLMSYPTPCGR